jgi:hypothetical protein
MASMQESYVEGRLLERAPAGLPNKMKEVTMESYTGQVYDLDFIQGQDSCQALIRQGNGNIVVNTSDARMQTILATAMIMKQDVDVYYEEGTPNILTRAKLNV